jgi:DNA-binding NtrC family response regulator
VLLVEDDPMVRTLAGRTLGQMWIRLRVAASGEEATTVIDTLGVPDLLVTDLGLPDVTGVALARRVWALQPRVPVVVMTGQDPDDGTFTRAELDRLFLLHKPFLPSALEDAVRQLLAFPPGR